MDKQVYSSDSSFEKEWGYNRAIRIDNTIYLSATGGWNYETMEMSPDPAEQARQTFKNMDNALEQFGASLADLVRLEVMYQTREIWHELLPVLIENIAAARPTLSAYSPSDVPDDLVKLEMVGTAVIGSGKA